MVVDESCKLVDQEESDSLKEELLEYIKKRFESAAEELKEQQTSRKKKDKIVKYAKKLLDDLDKIDFSLEEQFNNVLKKYADILNDYKKMLAQRMKIRFEGNINLGQIFSKMRNEIGHGHPKDVYKRQNLVREAAITYQIQRGRDFEMCIRDRTRWLKSCWILTITSHLPCICRPLIRWKQSR